MSDLFDRVAMRALGSQANLRPRHRTRFEPMAAPAPSPDIELSSGIDASTRASDDPLPEASSVDVERTLAVGEPLKRDSTTPSEKSPIRPARSLEQAPETVADPARPPRPLPQNSAPREPGAAIEARAGATPAGGVDAYDDPVPSRPASVVPARVTITPVAAPPVAKSPDLGGLTSPPEPPAGQSDHRLERMAAQDSRTTSVRVDLPTKPVTEPLALTALLDVTSPTRRAPPSRFSEDGHEVAVSAPTVGPAAAPQPFADPLGVHARARIERLPPAIEPRIAPAPAPTPSIEVTIGRLEIRAGSAPPPRPAKPFAPHVDLAAYRARKEGA